MRRSLLGAVLRTAARADTALDVQILQTACSLEALAVAAYDSVLARGLPDTLAAFARETRRQHDEHRKAFQAQTLVIDPNARVQDAPNPKFLPLLTGADLSTSEKVVDLAALLEKVATDSYLLNLTMLGDSRTKALMGSVMCVEAQHLAALRVARVAPLGASDMMKVPTTVGSGAFSAALHQVEQVAEPSSGAVG